MELRGTAGQEAGEDCLMRSSTIFTLHTCMRAVQEVSSYFEHLENWSRDLDVTWQPVRGDLTVHP